MKGYFTETFQFAIDHHKGPDEAFEEKTELEGPENKENSWQEPMRDTKQEAKDGLTAE